MKPLDKMTKSELVALVQCKLVQLHDADRALTQAQADLARKDREIAELSDQITTLERRRLNEGNGYRKLIAKKSRHHVPPSQDDSISDDQLTPAQRVLRAHRKNQIQTGV